MIRKTIFAVATVAAIGAAALIPTEAFAGGGGKGGGGKGGGMGGGHYLHGQYGHWGDGLAPRNRGRPVCEFGNPFPVAGFGNWFREQCDVANLHHCTFHGLRKAAS